MENRQKDKRLNQRLTLSGNVVDIVNKQIFAGIVEIVEGKICSITRTTKPVDSQFILPGFIDAHIHIESSLLVPSEFARLAVPHGTVATVSDPHEIGNVLGIEGVRYMIRNASHVPFHFHFGAPACVPVTSFETAGACITAHDIHLLFEEDKLQYLSEVMQYPAVLAHDPIILEKIKLAQERGLPIDGHSPGLMGHQAQHYIDAGMSTDHECYTLEEALHKLACGMKITIREGSAAKNYEALHSLLASHPEAVMFCSDDKHPDELVKGHINELVKRSIAKGYDQWDVLRCACYNPIIHYKLPVGFLQVGQGADFIVVDNLTEFTILKTYIKGNLVAEKGQTLISSVQNETINYFETCLKTTDQFVVKGKAGPISIIGVMDGELITKKLELPATMDREEIVVDLKRDILKLSVTNRYYSAPPQLAFIKGFGLKKGALASCIAHDSHNIVAVGVSDEDLCQAVNAIIAQKGGLAIACDGEITCLPLPIAGIMSADDGYSVAKHYAQLDQLAKQLGSPLYAPFMTLSFMALLVIPSLKLSDQGLFHVEAFA